MEISAFATISSYLPKCYVTGQVLCKGFDIAHDPITVEMNWNVFVLLTALKHLIELNIMFLIHWLYSRQNSHLTVDNLLKVINRRNQSDV